VYIYEATIKKPGKLTDAEVTQICRHPMSMGFKFLRETKQINEEYLLIVLQHYERNDGNGHPKNCALNISTFMIGYVQ
jgi:HD-GYP domain-containing protein (c-di-GMP phosphodiesterase class II)